MVTEVQAQELVAESKEVRADLSWRTDGESFRLEAEVRCLESGAILSLRGTVGKRNRSFVLLCQDTPIRKYTVHAFHRDPVTRQRVTQPHKHLWDDEWGDKRVYIPDDIRSGNVDEEFVDFLRECNIELQGEYTQLLPA